MNCRWNRLLPPRRAFWVLGSHPAGGKSLGGSNCRYGEPKIMPTGLISLKPPREEVPW